MALFISQPLCHREICHLPLQFAKVFDAPDELESFVYVVFDLWQCQLRIALFEFLLNDEVFVVDEESCR